MRKFCIKEKNYSNFLSSRLFFSLVWLIFVAKKNKIKMNHVSMIERSLILLCINVGFLSSIKLKVGQRARILLHKQVLKFSRNIIGVDEKKRVAFKWVRAHLSNLHVSFWNHRNHVIWKVGGDSRRWSDTCIYTSLWILFFGCSIWRSFILGSQFSWVYIFFLLSRIIDPWIKGKLSDLLAEISFSSEVSSLSSLGKNRKRGEEK